MTADVVQLQLHTRSDRLRQRRLENLPVKDGVFIGDQRRGWGPQTTAAPADLRDLITSIATSGVLQPILCEEIGDRFRVVAGHRRLAACRWGAVNANDNANFVEIPAVVVPGPLSEEERRAFQLIENLGRVDLQPGELAAALLYERCAVLDDALDKAGARAPAATRELEDPIARWDHLEFDLRAGVASLFAGGETRTCKIALRHAHRQRQSLGGLCGYRCRHPRARISSEESSRGLQARSAQARCRQSSPPREGDRTNHLLRRRGPIVVHREVRYEEAAGDQGILAGRCRQPDRSVAGTGRPMI